MDEEATIATLEGQPVRAVFPLRTTMFGIEAVVIPATTYAQLVRSTSRPAPRSTTSRIEADPEVADFLAQMMAQLGMTEAQERCLARFGASRTPSMSAIHRFRQRLAAGSQRAS